MVALALTYHLDVGNHLDISMMCGVLLEGDIACRAGAINAGYAMFIGMAICLVLAVMFSRRFSFANDRGINEQSTFGWCLLTVFILLAAHITWIALNDTQLSRIGAITRQSSFLSLENLIWPLLLQLMNSSKSMKFKFLYFSLLLPVISFSPYRGVLFAVMVFGFCLPLLAVSANSKGKWTTLFRQRRTLIAGGVVLLVAMLLLSSIYTDTRNRSSGAVATQAQQDSPSKLKQRLAYPLFQAHFAERAAEYEPLPTVWDEVLVKLRLVSKPNLNEYLYGSVYGEGTAGEMTSLYYGEAVANGISSPLIWIVTGPMLLVALWLALQRRGYEIGTLVGIAIWRGSLGGVATVLPALLIQIVAIVALSRPEKKPQQDERAYP